MLKEAEALLVVTDTRTGVQVAVVQGNAKVRDLGGNLELGRLTILQRLRATAIRAIIEGVFSNRLFEPLFVSRE
jgi:hypothetical protein